MLGKMIYEDSDEIDFEDPNKINLVSQISIKGPVEYTRGKQRIVLLDCGVKNSIIRAFLRRDIAVLKCPWNYDFSNETFDGIVLSNGPGDPSVCGRTVENVKKALSQSTPILGICLGSQILGPAAGARRTN